MTARFSAWPVVAGFLALGAGCATAGNGAAGGAQPAEETAAAQDADAYRCPAEIPGTRYEMVETDHGVALVFRNDDPQMVEVLRQKVHTLPGEIARRQSKLGEDREIPRVQSSSDDVGEDGAQIVILPMLPEDRLALQNYAHQRAPELAEARCPEEELIR